MSKHAASVHWSRIAHPLESDTYSRNHQVSLNGEQNVNVSASKEYKGDPRCADPEQLLVTALASCHMLTFLAIADLQGYRVEQYDDSPVGHLEKLDDGLLGIGRVELSPKVVFGGTKTPDSNALARLHAAAHKNCFIRNSLKAQVSIS